MYRKWLTIIITLCLIHTNLMAQEALAKLRYQEAEEAFNAGNFSLTLKKLDEVVGILKDENPRTLYLRIQAQKAMLPADPCQNEELAIQLMNSSKLYVSRYEKVPALQDNAIEVYKIMDASGVTPTTAAERSAYEEIKNQWASLDYNSLRKLYEAHTAKYSSCLTRNAKRELNLVNLADKNNAIIAAGEQATDNMLLDYLNQEIECKRYFGKTEFTNNYKQHYSRLTRSEANVLQNTPDGTLALIPVEQFVYGGKKLKIMKKMSTDYPGNTTYEVLRNLSALCPSGWRLPNELELTAWFESTPENLKDTHFGLFESNYTGETTPGFIFSSFLFKPRNNISDDIGIVVFQKDIASKNPEYYMKWSTSFWLLSAWKTPSQQKNPKDVLKTKTGADTIDQNFFKSSKKGRRPFCQCIYIESQP